METAQGVEKGLWTGAGGGRKVRDRRDRQDKAGSELARAVI